MVYMDVNVNGDNPTVFAPVSAAGLGSEWSVTSPGLGLTTVTGQPSAKTATVGVPADATPGTYKVAVSGSLTGQFAHGNLGTTTATITVAK